MRRYAACVVVLAGAVAGGVSANHFGVRAALAVTCPQVQYNTEAYNDGGTAHRGIRANGGMYIADTAGTVTCARVSSIQIQNYSGTEQVEAGWFDASGEGGCHYTGSGPRLLWFAVINTKNYCATQTPDQLTDTGQYDTWGLSDNALDGNWEFKHSGIIYKNLSDTDLLHGYQTTNGERHSTSDIPDAHFKGMQYMDDTASWVDFSSASAWGAPGANTDPAYCNNIISATEIQVKPNSC
jgi:hypothetical protein